MKASNQYSCVVTIAGSDSSGGAGIQADIKAISATGGYAASIITALTAQNTQGVQSIYPVPDYFVADQFESVFTDLNVNAVKIGMLFDESIIKIVHDSLKKYQARNVVLDPVMVAKNGHELLKPNTVEHLKQLFPLAALITPNLHEAEKLLGGVIKTFADMESAAATLGNQFKTNVLIKGGHLDSPKSSDVIYYYQNSSYEWFHSERIATQNTHGTGCTLSSAIASFLAQQCSISQAIHKAKEYLQHAIQAGSLFQLGSGCGPVNHFYKIYPKITQTQC